MNDLSQPQETKLTLGELAVFIIDEKDALLETGAMLKAGHFARIETQFHPLLIKGWIDCLQEILRNLDKDSEFISKYANNESRS